MPLVGDVFARYVDWSCADDGWTRNHNRLREINSHSRRKVIPLPAAQSCRAGINRHRRRRKTRGEPASRDSVIWGAHAARVPAKAARLRELLLQLFLRAL